MNFTFRKVFLSWPRKNGCIEFKVQFNMNFMLFHVGYSLIYRDDATVPLVSTSSRCSCEGTLKPFSSGGKKKCQLISVIRVHIPFTSGHFRSTMPHLIISAGSWRRPIGLNLKGRSCCIRSPNSNNELSSLALSLPQLKLSIRTNNLGKPLPN